MGQKWRGGGGGRAPRGQPGKTQDPSQVARRGAAHSAIDDCHETVPTDSISLSLSLARARAPYDRPIDLAIKLIA